MNLLEMLVAANKPLQKTSQGHPKRSGNPNPDTKMACKAKHDYAMEKYRTAMGSDWVTTKQIADRLGYAGAASCHGTLADYERAGLIERRHAGPGEWNRRKGYEWRWKK